MIKEEQATSGHEHQHRRVKSGETPTMRDVLKNRDFLKLWIAQILSQTAQQIVNFALVLQVDQISKSSTATAGVIISFTVPGILFAAIAGVFVERNSKRAMLTITNIVRGVLVLAYLFSDGSWGAGAVLTIFYIITLVFSTASQFFSPAEASMIPLVVKREELVAANSLFNLTLTATQLMGFVVLGPLLLATVFRNNFSGLYIVIFILCIAAAAATYFLPKDKPMETMAELWQHSEHVGPAAPAPNKWRMVKTGARTAWGELCEGWDFIRKEPVIISAILYWSVAIAVFMMLGTIGPQFLEKVLNISAENLYIVLIPGGLGLVLGVLVIGRVSHEGNRASMINRSLLGAGVALVAFAVLKPLLDLAFGMVNATPPNWLVMTLMGAVTLLLGMFNSFISVPAQTALQERSPEEVRARVFSAFYTVSNAILLVPVFFAGALADSIGHVQTVAAIGVVALLIAAAGLYRSARRPATITSATPALSANGQVTPAEAEAALAVGSPSVRPIPAETEQQARSQIHEKHD